MGSTYVRPRGQPSPFYGHPNHSDAAPTTVLSNDARQRVDQLRSSHRRDVHRASDDDGILFADPIQASCSIGTHRDHPAVKLTSRNGHAILGDYRKPSGNDSGARG